MFEFDPLRVFQRDTFCHVLLDLIGGAVDMMTPSVRLLLFDQLGRHIVVSQRFQIAFPHIPIPPLAQKIRSKLLVFLCEILAL